MAHSIASPSKISTRTHVTLPTTVGLDLSDQVSHYHVQLGDGRTLSTGKVKTTQEELRGLFKRWKGCRLVIEAGGHSPWVSRLGQACGMEVVVANPRRVELISKNDRKTDRTDAETLAELGRSNPKLLAPITHRTKEAQAHLAIQRARNEVVSMRTSLINHVRGVLKSHGHRTLRVSPESFGKRAASWIPPELTTALLPIVELVKATNARITAYEKEIERLGIEQYPIARMLQEIAGVGPIVSVSFVLTLDDVRRFKNGREVGAYLGLVPRQKSSGESNPQMHITKAGDHEMRRLLVLAANYILGRNGPDCDLRRFGDRIAGNGGNKIAKKRARVAVARKLALLMHHLWRTGETYDPFHVAKKRGEPLPT